MGTGKRFRSIYLVFEVDDEAMTQPLQNYLSVSVRVQFLQSY